MRIASLVLRLSCTAALSFAMGACTAGADDAAADQSSAINEANGNTANEAPREGTRVRLIAGNLTSGNLQSYDPGEGIRLLKGLHGDVAMLQEMNYGNNSQADLDSFVSQAFDAGFTYTVESDRAQIPNGIVSRWPIIESGTWPDPQVSNRAFQWARIDIPGDKDLWAVSVHLLTSSAANRNAEARSLVGRLKTAVPASDYLVIGGDFNTGNRNEGCLQTFGQLTRTTGPWPVDTNGKDGTNASRKKPLDWVIVDPDLEAIETPVQIGTRSFENGFVLDSRTFPDLPAIAPVRKNDSGASSMQHMAVVRDFVLAE